MKLKDYIKSDKLVVDINDEDFESIIKNTKRFIKICDRNNLLLEFRYNNKKLSDNMLKKDISNDLRDIITIMHAINIKDKYKRYDYIYDTVCGYLDEKIKTNYCQFKDDICIKYRNKNQDHKNGCCECKGRGKCKYLIDSVCTMKSCMACKLFTCKTLRKMGIKENINDYVLIKYFLNTKEKDILKFSYWTPKEIVMQKIFKNVK